MSTIVSEAQDQSGQQHAFPWTGIIWFGVLLIICYAPVLKLLVWQWANDEDMGHDTLPVFDFDESEFLSALERLNGSAPVFRISATKGEGVKAWADWLAGRAQSGPTA